MAADESKSIRDYVEKLADDKLAEVMGEPKTGASRRWTEDINGGKWSDDDLEWEGYKPREDVARNQREFFDKIERNGARVHRRKTFKAYDDVPEMPSFLDRREKKRQQYGVSDYKPEEWARVVRPQGGMVVLSDFMVTQITDILMREMCDVLERAQLIFVSEAASQNVRQGFRKIVGEYVQFLNKDTGEYSDVEVE